MAKKKEVPTSDGMSDYQLATWLGMERLWKIEQGIIPNEPSEIPGYVDPPPHPNEIAAQKAVDDGLIDPD